MFCILSDDSLPSLSLTVEETLPTLNPAVEDALLEFLRVEVSEYSISLHGRYVIFVHTESYQAFDI